MSVTIAKLHEINKIRHSCYGYSTGTGSIQRAQDLFKGQGATHNPAKAVQLSQNSKNEFHNDACAITALVIY